MTGETERPEYATIAREGDSRESFNLFRNASRKTLDFSSGSFSGARGPVITDQWHQSAPEYSSCGSKTGELGIAWFIFHG